MTSAATDRPALVGPHDDRELALMLAGRKPAAMFYDVVPASIDLPEADFAPHVTAGRLVRREEIYAGRDGGRAMRYVYYVLPGEMQRLEQLHAINAAIYSGQRQATEADDIEIGRLLGYTEAEIAAYVKHSRGLRQKLRQMAPQTDQP
ncbi:hypothetical protein [Ferrovibrio xuzhouensis]|uniref:Uncharacterized protein n=1 Tax=Ferrovibrio xuzhouensis TaxID=1576914 RepID=A0ABV7VD62_9PROT